MSQRTMKDVRSAGKVVGQVEVTTYDNLDEAQEVLGEEACVAYINKGVTIEVMDGKRREITGTGSTGVRDLMKRIKEAGLLDEVKKLLGEPVGS